MTDPLYLVAGCKSWNREVFDAVIRHYPGRWEFIGSKGECTVELIRQRNPRYVFFLHWSWRVAPEIVRDFECVCFHMTDVPYGRGGSPLQNLILRGHTTTKLTALRMTNELDAGPVYLKEDLRLDGNAEEILRRATEIAARMIAPIIREQPQPTPQTGQVVVFERRAPAASEIPALPSVACVYDFIRMLDGEGYPRAFIQREGFRYEFDRASLAGQQLTARVVITPAPKEKP